MTLPSTWTLVTLDKVVVDIQPGFARRPNSEPIGIPQLRTNNVSPEGNLDLSEVKYVDATDGEIAAYSVRRGDVIFNNTNSFEWVGKTAYFDLDDEPYVISNHMTRIRVNEDVIEPEYLARYLHFLWQTGNVQRFAKQWVNQAAIDQSGLAQLEIILPALPEQRRIVQILLQADALRRLRDKSNTILEDMRASLFAEMFGEEVAKEHSWDVRKISDFGDVSYGLTVNRERRESSIQYPYLRVANVYAWRLDLNEIATIGVLEDDLRRYSLKPNDVLVVEGHGDRSQLGRAAVWDAQIDPCLHQNHLLRIRPFADVISPRYLAGYINSPQGRAYMLRYGKTSSGLNTINSTVLANIPLPYPPLSLQREFESRLSTYDVLEADYRTSSVRFEDLFQSTLAQSFSGLLSHHWRSIRAKELADVAVQRDIALGLRGQEPTPRDYERGRVTQSEREVIERQLLDTSRSVIGALAAFQPDLSVSNLLGTFQTDWGTQFANIFGAAEQIKIPDFSYVVSDSLRNAVLGLDVSAIGALGSVSSGVADVLASMMPSPLSGVLSEFTSFFEGWDFADHPRDYVLNPLTMDQFRIFLACPKAPSNELAEVTQFDKTDGNTMEAGAKAPRAVTAQEVQEKVGQSMDTVRRGLDLLVSLGLLAAVSILAESADGLTFVTAYQSIGQSDDVRLADLALLKEPEQA